MRCEGCGVGNGDHDTGIEICPQQLRRQQRWQQFIDQTDIEEFRLTTTGVRSSHELEESSEISNTRQLSNEQLAT